MGKRYATFKNALEESRHAHFFSSGWKDLVLELMAGVQAATFNCEEEAMCPKHI